MQSVLFAESVFLKNKGSWDAPLAKQFLKWQIVSYSNKFGSWDRGSMNYEFQTNTVNSFRVIAIDKEHWTEKQKKEGLQIYYIGIHNKADRLKGEKFYLLNIKSEQELHLLDLLKKINPDTDKKKQELILLQKNIRTRKLK